MDTQPTTTTELVKEGEQVVYSDPAGAWALVQKSPSERVARIKMPDGTVHEQVVANDPLPTAAGLTLDAAAMPAVDGVTKALEYAALAGSAVATAEGVAATLQSLFGKKE